MWAESKQKIAMLRFPETIQGSTQNQYSRRKSRGGIGGSGKAGERLQELKLTVPLSGKGPLHSPPRGRQQVLAKFKACALQPPFSVPICLLLPEFPGKEGAWSYLEKGFGVSECRPQLGQEGSVLRVHSRLFICKTIIGTLQVILRVPCGSNNSLL